VRVKDTPPQVLPKRRRGFVKSVAKVRADYEPPEEDPDSDECVPDEGVARKKTKSGKLRAGAGGYDDASDDPDAGGHAGAGKHAGAGGQAGTGGVDPLRLSQGASRAVSLGMASVDTQTEADVDKEGIRGLFKGMSAQWIARNIPSDMIKCVVKELKQRLKRPRTEADRLKDEAHILLNAYMNTAPIMTQGLHSEVEVQATPEGREGTSFRPSKTLGNNVPIASYFERFMERVEARAASILPPVPQPTEGVEAPAGGQALARRHVGYANTKRVGESKQTFRERTVRYIQLRVPVIGKFQNSVFAVVLRSSGYTQWIRYLTEALGLQQGPRNDFRIVLAGNLQVMKNIPRAHIEMLNFEPITKATEGVTFFNLYDVQEDPEPLSDDVVETLCTEELTTVCLEYDRLARERLRYEGKSLQDFISNSILEENRLQVERYNSLIDEHNRQVDKELAMSPEELSELRKSRKDKKRGGKGGRLASDEGKRTEQQPKLSCRVFLISMGHIPKCQAGFEFKHYPPCPCAHPLVRNPVVDPLLHSFYRGGCQRFIQFTVPRDVLGYTQMTPACMLVKPGVSVD
jgi:hypothetical protein